VCAGRRRRPCVEQGNKPAGVVAFLRGAGGVQDQKDVGKCCTHRYDWVSDVKIN
jgi:hypothetical protein